MTSNLIAEPNHKRPSFTANKHLSSSLVAAAMWGQRAVRISEFIHVPISPYLLCMGVFFSRLGVKTYCVIHGTSNEYYQTGTRGSISIDRLLSRSIDSVSFPYPHLCGICLPPTAPYQTALNLLNSWQMNTATSPFHVQPFITCWRYERERKGGLCVRVRSYVFFNT